MYWTKPSKQKGVNLEGLEDESQSIQVVTSAIKKSFRTRFVQSAILEYTWRILYTYKDMLQLRAPMRRRIVASLAVLPFLQADDYLHLRTNYQILGMIENKHLSWLNITIHNQSFVTSQIPFLKVCCAHVRISHQKRANKRRQVEMGRRSTSCWWPCLRWPLRMCSMRSVQSQKVWVCCNRV